MVELLKRSSSRVPKICHILGSGKSGSLPKKCLVFSLFIYMLAHHRQALMAI